MTDQRPGLALAMLVLSACPVAAAQEPAAPVALDDIDSWTCARSAAIDDHFGATLEILVANPAANTRVGAPAEPDQVHYYVYWTEKQGHIAQGVSFWPLTGLSVSEIGLPKRVEFDAPGPRMQGGRLELVSAEGAVMGLEADGDAIQWLAPTFLSHWVKLGDPGEIAAIVAGSGWRMRHVAGGDSRELGAAKIVAPAAAQAAYAVLRPQLAAMVADPAHIGCRVNPIDYDAMMAEVI